MKERQHPEWFLKEYAYLCAIESLARRHKRDWEVKVCRDLKADLLAFIGCT